MKKDRTPFEWIEYAHKLESENQRLKEQYQDVADELADIARQALESTPSPSEPTVPDKPGYYWRKIEVVHVTKDRIHYKIGGMTFSVFSDDEKIDNVWGGRCKEPSEKGQL